MRLCAHRIAKRTAEGIAQRTAEGMAQGFAQGTAQSTAQGVITFSAAEVCVYCDSPQNGHLAVRACSGLRQCQQKLACGVSRAFRRDWISDT